MSDYGVKDIKTLEGIEAIRLRPGMYIGSVGPEGVRHITLEIISNAVDEYLNGYCTECSIRVEEDGLIDIMDNGRGVPFGKAEDGSETLVNIYTKLHTGAKFDSEGKTGYNTSGGMNGVGAKATNALSEYFTVQSSRDRKSALAEFEKGQLVHYEEFNWAERCYSGAYPERDYCDTKNGVIVIPEGYYFVLGDNRGGSKDSRDIGLVKEEDIIGKTKYIVNNLFNPKKID